MQLSTPVNFDDLLNGYEWVSAGAPFENCAFVSRTTGKIHFSSIMVDVEEELPDDIDDGSIYQAIPHKYDLDLGHDLAMRFVEEHLPDAYDVASAFFRQRGAYARFKSLLEKRNKLQDWYEYRDNAVEATLREWCAENGIALKQ